MTREEMLARMEQFNQDGSSKLHMRSENLQNKVRVSRMPMLKKELKKKSKLLLVCDLALPFNPATGMADEKFNPDNKYRPPFSATTVALLLKSMADENPDLKNTLMKRSGVSEWDTSDSATFTQVDWKVFVKYRVPRIFSIPVVNIKIPAMVRSEIGRDYAINVKRNPLNGEIEGEWPVALKVNKLFRDRIYEQIAEYDEQIKSGERNETEEQQKKYKSDLYSTNPVSDDHPANWVELLELPLTKQYMLSADVNLASLTAEDVSERIVLSRYSKALKDIILSYMQDELVRYDNYFDFFEIDMNCPLEGDATTNQGKMLIGKDTKFEKPSMRLNEIEGYDNLIEKMRDVINEDTDIEEKVYRSSRVAQYNETVENQLLMALPTVFELDDPYVTDKVIMANKEIISLAFADEGIDLIDEVDADVSDKNNGNLNEGASAANAKQYDLNSEEFTDMDTEDLDQVPLE